MKLTRHAGKRAQQRGISWEQLALMAMFGTEVSRDAEAVKIGLTEGTLARLRAALERCKGKVIVMDDVCDRIITTYTLTR